MRVLESLRGGQGSSACAGAHSTGYFDASGSWLGEKSQGASEPDDG